MRSKQFFNPAYIVLLCAIIVVILMSRCSKSSGYGSGDNGNGTGNNISIKNYAFSAGSLNINSGVTVTWTNNDATTHTVTADNNSFDSGDIAPGKSYSKTFTSTGTFNYHCKYHSGMTGTVVVKY